MFLNEVGLQQLLVVSVLVDAEGTVILFLIICESHRRELLGGEPSEGNRRG